MYRRKTPTDNPCNDLEPHDSHALREERWARTIKNIDDNFMKSLDADANQMAQPCHARGAASAPSSNPSTVDGYFSVMHAPGTLGSRSQSIRSSFVISKKSLREWIHMQNMNSAGDVMKTKKYFEKCVRVIHSLVLKMIVTDVKDGKTEVELAVDPRLVNSENILVHYSLEEEETVHLVQSEGDQRPYPSDVSKKYDAMKALGVVAYELLMRGSGPPIQAFFSSTVTNSSDATQLLLSISDSADKFEETSDTDHPKRQKSTSSEKNQGRLSAAMISAGVPHPLCRFVVDLVGEECCDGLLFRSDNSFESFSEVIQDLEQMMGNPEAFIHLAVKEQLRVVFGEKMHGRESELQQMLDVASRVTGFKTNDALFEALAMIMQQNKQQFAFVTGQPGCGKSRLVMETRKALENQGWFFLSCKFDRIVHSEPLSIIACAFDEFLGEYQSSSRRQLIRGQLEKIMQTSDIAVLIKRVPSLIKYVESPTDHFEDLQMNKEQMHQVFSQLLRALSTCGHPVAFFLDDLQWADTASLELLIALTLTSEPELSSDSSGNNKDPKVLFIGSYRDNEAQNNPQLVQMLQQLKQTEAVEVTTIAVAGFDSDTLNRIASESLCMPLRRTKHLTDVISQKTDGIVIHIIEFIGRLTMERILNHSFVKGWEWESELLESCPISSSVAELFSYKLKSLPSDALRGLQICSLFGIQIDQRIISLLRGYDGNKSVDITEGIKSAMELGLIETSSDVYRFSHDIIAQAAFDSISKAEQRSQLLQKLAAALIKNATDIDSIIFVVVDLINRMKNSEITDLDERLQYARMNERAGKKALLVPDFNSAAKYTESAISFMHKGHWPSHHDLMLSIYETSVLALYSCTNANQKTLMSRIAEVLQQAKSLDEEFRTRYVWIKVLATESMPKAIDECRILLGRLGEPIDLSDINASIARAELARVKEAYLEEKRDISLVQMTDSYKLKSMKILSLLSVFYYMERNFMNSIVVARMVELSMNFGCCEESPFAFAHFSALVAGNLHDIDGGCNIARMALDLMAKSRSANTILPSVYGAVYGLSLVWKEPLQATMDPLLLGCRIGFDVGEIEFAVANLQVYCPRSLYCGKNIKVLMREVELLAQKCSRHGEIKCVQYCLTPLYNVLRGLQGLDDQVLAPLDTFMSNDELLDLTLVESHRINFELQLMLEITYSFVMRDMIKTQHTMRVYRENVSKERLAFNHLITDFYVGLASCYFARQNRDNYSHNIEAARSIRDVFKNKARWNFHHKSLLLTAECHYAEGETAKAIESYNLAIAAAKEHKFLQDEALACELVAYFYKEQGNEPKSIEMFRQARDAYNKWGAVKKANSLPQSTG